MAEGDGTGCGPVEEATRADLALLDPVGTARALAETAYVLARALDRGRPGMATAAIAKEFRATLAELTEGSDDDALGAQLGAWLSTPVGHGEGPEPSDAG